MKNTFCLFALLFQVFAVVSYGKPMESYENYNVILVHGAGGRFFGLDCDDSNYDEAYEYLSDDDKALDTRKDYQKIIGGYGDRLLDISVGMPDSKLTIGVSLKKRLSSAQDMDAEKEDGENVGLLHWLTESVFDSNKSVIYLNRPFTNPANSPANNAIELGSRTWAGDGNCITRRSKIEEAQEVVAKGRVKLKKLREIAANRDKLPPSRNILIAHSMGGVASREYVQGKGYNNDVDKVITLDSPHEGTGSLEMLLDMRDDEIKRLEQAASKTAITYAATSLLLAAAADNLATATVALYSTVSAAVVLAGEAVTYGLGYGLTKLLDKHYEKEDSLTPYINPKHSNCNISGICNLKNRPYTDSLPMMRLLYGTNSMKMI